ncbi:hypothetical protein EV701_107278 [Chthoniobacter flavus]|nr:hypothetical protein [Chthoniobacter flavus]TCO91996.1 hypothetical protein EV701_107278 [Chthoniobacter flavus]
MKKLTTPLLATLFALSAAGRLTAADPDSAFGLAPSAAPQLPQVNPAPAPAPATSLPLIPEAPQQSLEKPTNPAATATGDAATKAAKSLGDKTAAEEDKLKKKIALQQAKTKAARDPELQAIYKQALAAPTDFEQRKLFIDYYNGLVDRMAKFNPKLAKEEVAALRSQYTGRFFQTRIAPTIDPATFRKQ